MPRIALLSTSDTDLLTARASGADYVVANPGRPAHQEMAADFESADPVASGTGSRVRYGDDHAVMNVRRFMASRASSG